MLAAGLGVFALTRGPSGAPVVPVVTVDAGVVEAPGTMLDLEPQPPNAIISIDGKRLPKVGAQLVPVSPGVKIHVRIEAPGYAAYDRDVVPRARETTRIDQTLQPAPATLHVESTPAGAQVSLEGKPLGDTPLTSTGLAATAGAAVVIAHPGYETVRVKVDLIAGETAQVTQALKEIQRFGYVKITIKPFAEVFYKGTDLGVNTTVAAPVPFRLPAGKQQLTLVNKVKNQRKTIWVTVVADQATSVSASFD